MEGNSTSEKGKLEKEKETLIRKMNQGITDELKDTIDIAYKLSKKKEPEYKATWTHNSSTDGYTH